MGGCREPHIIVHCGRCYVDREYLEIENSVLFKLRIDKIE
jgi:hypothetical protein